MTSSFRRQLKLRARRRHYRRYWNTVDRSSYSCPSCGQSASGIGDGFEVHHRDGDPLNGHMTNLVALCHHCHVSAHRIENVQRALTEWKQDVPGARGVSASLNQHHTVYSWSFMDGEGGGGR